MTDRTRKRRRRSFFRRIKRKAIRLAAWTVLYGAELLIAAVPTLAAAAIILLLAYKTRGGPGVGGEWLVLGGIYWLAYVGIHRLVCRKLFDEEVRE